MNRILLLLLFSLFLLPNMKVGVILQCQPRIWPTKTALGGCQRWKYMVKRRYNVVIASNTMMHPIGIVLTARWNVNSVV